MSKKYDYIVVGGGIAGLASSELLSRSGYKVLLLEKSSKICSEASASHHGWFHFGSLYSIFPENHTLRTLVGGIEDLLENYSSFENMNIKINKDGKIHFPDEKKCGWVRDEPLEYIVSARNNNDFSMFKFDGAINYLKKIFFILTWEIAIKQFISRHVRFYKHNWLGKTAASKWIPKAGIADYSKDVIEKPCYKDIDLDKDSHFKVVGYDRPMRSTIIVRDLVRSLLGSGGDIKVNELVTSINSTKNKKIVNTDSGNSFKGCKVIISAGKWLGDFRDNNENVKVVASPLLVTYPAVTEHNFVRMTPFMEKSINHIYHEIDGKRYSVIGGGDYADPNNEDDMKRTVNNLRNKAMETFPKMKQSLINTHYLGYKTEVITNLKERNYQYLIRENDDGIIKIIPGKFTLGFSLAYNLFLRLHNKKPNKDVKLATNDQANKYLGESHHGRLVTEGLSNKK